MPDEYFYELGNPIHEKDEPTKLVQDFCPLCGKPTIINTHSVECSDFDNCDFFEEIPEPKYLD